MTLLSSETPLRDTPDRIQGVFFFDPEDRIYKDHFPGYAVVPGSLIVHAFATAAEKAGLLAPEAGTAFHVEGFRFRKFISPGRYAYTIETQGKRLACRLVEQENVLASGAIVQ